MDDPDKERRIEEIRNLIFSFARYSKDLVYTFDQIVRDARELAQLKTRK